MNAGTVWLRCRVLVLMLFLSGVGLTAQAHESRPLYIELNQTGPDRYQLHWKTPPSVPDRFMPAVSLPETCSAVGQAVRFAGTDGIIQRQQFDCPASPAGGVLRIDYPGPNPSISALVRYTTLNGERHSTILGPDRREWLIPEGESTGGVAREYLLLGVEHIWAGIDHLLFLVGLLWIAGTWRRILVTITGFTIAHSLTLILSALNVVRLPIAPVEAVIALSIVFLATEIVKGPRDSLTWRRPISVSCSFGLLHGFGFAAVLAEIGLPQTELVTGLLFFNLGVEVGQVIFAGVVIGLMSGMRHYRRRFGGSFAYVFRPEPVRLAAGYVVGTVAAYWVVERCVAFLPAV
ncbi:MAG: HupE/UreJ family protein [Gammaproteobacteria bacterium]